ncbi:hypothetical protein FRC03_003379 [Tulasnella sp. 419]|nr:hypothetical protein FRC03_003379 [Tulasnella sp. 419]
MLRFFTSATTSSPSTSKTTPPPPPPVSKPSTPASSKPVPTPLRPTSTSSVKSSSGTASPPASPTSSSGRSRGERGRGPPAKKPPPGKSPLASSVTVPDSPEETTPPALPTPAPALTLPPAATPRVSQVLPSVKCSQCDQSVPLSELGEHVCPKPQAGTSSPSPSPSPSQPPPPTLPPQPKRRPTLQSQSAIVVSDLQQPTPANKEDKDGKSHVAGANIGPSQIQSKSPPPTTTPLPPPNDHQIPRAPSRSSQKSDGSNGSSGSKTNGDTPPAMPPVTNSRRANDIPPQKPVPQGGLPPVQREPSPGPNPVPGPSLQRNPSGGAPPAPAPAPAPALSRNPSSDRPGYNKSNSETRYPSIDPRATFQPPPISSPVDPGKQAGHLVSIHGIPIPDTQTGGEAGMAGVGRRGFAAAAQAALWASAGPPSPFISRTPSPGFLGPQRIASPGMYGPPGRVPSPGMNNLGPPPGQGGRFPPPPNQLGPQHPPFDGGRPGNGPSPPPNQALRDPARPEGSASSSTGTGGAADGLGLSIPRQSKVEEQAPEDRGRASSIRQKTDRSPSRSRSRSPSRYGDEDDEKEVTRKKRETADRSSRVSDASAYSTYTSLTFNGTLRQPVNNLRPGVASPKRQGSTSSQTSTVSLGRSMTVSSKSTMSPITENDSPTTANGEESGSSGIGAKFFGKLKAKASRTALGRSISSASSSSSNTNTTTTAAPKMLGLDRILEKVAGGSSDDGKAKVGPSQFEKRRQRTLSTESGSSVGLAYARAPSPPPVPPLPAKDESSAGTAPLSLRKKDQDSNTIPFPGGGSGSSISSSSSSSASVSSNAHNLTKPKATFGGVTIITASDDTLSGSTDISVKGEVSSRGLLLPGTSTDVADSPTSPTSSSPSPTSTTFSGRKKTKTCVKCAKKITDGKWISIDGGAGGVMCEEDWKEMYLPKIPFPDKTFYVFDGKPYCGFHYAEMNNSLCSAPSCGKPIEGPCAVAETGQRFHPEHFVCDWEGLSDDEYDSDSDEDEEEDDAAGYGSGGKRKPCKNALVDYWEVGTKRYCCEKHATWAQASLHRAMSTSKRGDGGKATKRKTMFIDLGDRSLL